jgi:polysaccharide biosynthesis transport protein
LIAAQAQRFRLGLLQTDVRLREEQVNKRKEEAAKLKLQSQLTFANVAVLDKATPPIEPFFPKRPVVLSVAISASAILGLILALIAEMLDRRVRSTADLEFVTSAPTLGTIQAPRRAAWRLGGAHGVRPA